jgi:hypothetical protein
MFNQKKFGRFTPGKVFGKPNLGGVNVIGKLTDNAFTQGMQKMAISLDKHSKRLTKDLSCGVRVDEGFLKRKIWPVRTTTTSTTLLTTQKAEKEATFLQKALKSNSVFSEMDEFQSEDFVDAFEKVHFQSKELIIRQGDAGDYFYILYEGEVTLIDSHGEAAIHSSKDDGYCSFGEFAINHRKWGVFCGRPNVGGPK